ncbi:50S ribosomal protein L40e [Nanoarchaeota archaeon]
MAKFEEAQTRMFRNVFVCKRCKTKIRAPSIKVSQGVISCRRCKGKSLRPRRKK